MSDLNLLTTLDALLRDFSVAKAAERMHVSQPAMSRALARVREALGDPILVRAGRGLVPTPRALLLRERVRAAVEEAERLLSPGESMAPITFERTFSIRTSDAGMAVFGPQLRAQVAREAPRVTLRFVAEGDEDVNALRDGTVDLDIGVQGPLGPEVRTRPLLRESSVVLLRKGHPLLRGALTAERLASAEHVSVSRRGRTRGPLDEALEHRGLSRTVRCVVASHLMAAMLVSSSDAVLPTLSSFAVAASERFDLEARPLPFEMPPATVALAWHPRFDGDAAHAWMREKVMEAARELKGSVPRRGPSRPRKSG